MFYYIIFCYQKLLKMTNSISAHALTHKYTLLDTQAHTASQPAINFFKTKENNRWIPFKSNYAFNFPKQIKTHYIILIVCWAISLLQHWWIWFSVLSNANEMDRPTHLLAWTLFDYNYWSVFLERNCTKVN